MQEILNGMFIVLERFVIVSVLVSVCRLLCQFNGFLKSKDIEQEQGGDYLLTSIVLPDISSSFTSLPFLSNPNDDHTVII